MGPGFEGVRAGRGGGGGGGCARVLARCARLRRGLLAGAIAIAGTQAGLLAALPLPVRAEPAAGAQLVEAWGAVWLLEHERAAWVPASPGLPLAVGERLATGPGARAVVHAEGATLRIDASSEVERIAPGAALRVQLLAGRIALEVDATAARTAQVRTPQGRVLPLSAGHFRVDQVADATVVETLSGRADFETGRELRSVHTGQRLAFWRDHAGHLRADVVTMTADDFGRWLLAVPPATPRPWSTARPRLERERIEIEIHRGWVPHPGPAKPRVSPKGGRWVWMSPWGWVWVPERNWRPPPHHDRRLPPHDRRGDDRHWDDRRWDDRRWDDRRWDDRRGNDRHWDDHRRPAPGLRDPSGQVPTPRPPPRERAQRHPPDDGQPRFGRSTDQPPPRAAPEERRRDTPARPPGFTH